MKSKLTTADRVTFTMTRPEAARLSRFCTKCLEITERNKDDHNHLDIDLTREEVFLLLELGLAAAAV